MAIAHRASAVANLTTNTTSLTVTIPASIQTDDLLFLAVINRGAVDSPSVTDDDTGGNTWALVRGGVNPGAGQVWWKRATSGTASKTITVSGCTNSCSAALSGFSGGKTTDPPYENDTAENHASGTETRTGFTPSVDGSMICLAVINTANDNAVSTQSSTNPGALTELAEHLNTGGLDCATSIAAAIQATAAATGSLTWAQTDGTTISVAWNILPAVAAALPDGKQNFTAISGPVYAPSLRTWTQSPFIGNIPQPAAPPFTQTEWPLPKSAPYHVQLRTWLQQPYIGDIPPAPVQAPFRNTDWPNPKPVARSIEPPLTQSLALATFAATPLRPVQLALPAARIRFEPLNSVSSIALTAVAPQTPFNPVLHPNPVQALYPVHLRTWTQNLLATTLAPAADLPFAFMGWTLPRQAPRFTPVTLNAYSLPLNTAGGPADALKPAAITRYHLNPAPVTNAKQKPSAVTKGSLTSRIQ